MTHTVLMTLTLLAGVCVGEAGILSDDAMMDVGHVVLNRVEDDAFPNSVPDVIEEGFNGYQNPNLWDRLLAVKVLMRKKATDFLYALSLQDRLKLGCDEGDKIYRRGIWELHLYKEWCVNG